MQILIVSYSYPPMREVGGKRFYHLKKELIELGCNVYILCAQSEHVDCHIEHNVYRVGRLFFNRQTRLDLLSRALRRIWSKVSIVDQYIDWVINATPRLIWMLIKKQIDATIITGPPFSLFLMGYVVKLFGKALILDYRDPWFIYDSHRNKYGKHKLLHNKALEYQMVKRADSLVMNTDKALECYRSEFKAIIKKSLCITNGINTYSTDNRDVLDEPVDICDGKKFTICYAGNLYGKRKLHYLLPALDRAFKEGALSQDNFQFDIYGSLSTEDREMIYNKGWGKLFREFSYQDSQTLYMRLRQADLLYLVQGDDFRYSIPYKFYSYLETGRKILAIVSRDSATEQALLKLPIVSIGYVNEEETIFLALFMSIATQTECSELHISSYLWKNLGQTYYQLVKSI